MMAVAALREDSMTRALTLGEALRSSGEMVVAVLASALTVCAKCWQARRWARARKRSAKVVRVSAVRLEEAIWRGCGEKL